MIRMTNGNLTLLEFALIGLTAQSPKSGYDVQQVFETTEMRQFSSSPGSIYPALKRLERRGLLASEAEASGDRTRRVYRPTETGHERLAAWVVASVTVEEIREEGRAPILRFAFLGAVDADRRSVERFLRSYRESLEVYEGELRSVAEEMAGHTSPYPRLAVLHGIEQVRAQRSWAVRTMRQMGFTKDEDGP